jgi:hypothetical protein
MKILFILISLVIFAGFCHEKTSKKPAKLVIINDAGKPAGVQHPFANPALIFGSDFISFIAQLKLSYPGNYDTLVYFTSEETKKRLNRSEIIHWFYKTNLNFKKKLVAISKTIDGLLILNYRSSIMATNTLMTYTVAVENNVCRLVLPHNILK